MAFFKPFTLKPEVKRVFDVSSFALKEHFEFSLDASVTKSTLDDFGRWSDDILVRLLV